MSGTVENSGNRLRQKNSSGERDERTLNRILVHFFKQQQEQQKDEEWQQQTTFYNAGSGLI